MNSNNRIAAKLYFPRDIVCLRNININPLHKGDDDDDDNNNNKKKKKKKKKQKKKKKNIY